MNWQPIKIKDICVAVKSGGTPSSSNSRYYGGDIPWLRTQEVIFNRIKDTEIKITEHGLINSSAKWIPEKSVIVAMYGASAGRVAINEIPLTTNQACCNLIIDGSISDYRFVYYFLLHKYDSLKGLAKGAAQNNLNAGQVANFEILCPSLNQQLIIGDILSGYDDLIENNTHQIQLLEEAARQLYKEWFVRLRFPGHEQAKVVDGVPEGFCRMSLADLCQEKRDVVRPEKLNPETPYIGLEHMPRRSITLGDWEFADKVSSSKHKFQVGDILFGKIRPYFHKVGITFTDGIASSDALVIRSLRNNLLPLVLMVVSSDAFVAMTSKTVKEGSKMPRADWKHMQRYPVLLPPEGLLNSFNSAIEPILDQLRILVMMNKKLQEARDLLLPRLMSGEIRV